MKKSSFLFLVFSVLRTPDIGAFGAVFAWEGIGAAVGRAGADTIGFVTGDFGITKCKTQFEKKTTIQKPTFFCSHFVGVLAIDLAASTSSLFSTEPRRYEATVARLFGFARWAVWVWSAVGLLLIFAGWDVILSLRFSRGLKQNIAKREERQEVEGQTWYLFCIQMWKKTVQESVLFWYSPLPFMQ